MKGMEVVPLLLAHLFWGGHHNPEWRSTVKFEVGDRVQMPGVPIVVEVLELGPCGDLDCKEQLFRFADPGGQGDDWAHVSEFEKAEGGSR
jgi:hypothetical protein